MDQQIYAYEPVEKLWSVEEAGQWLANKWASLEERYGRKAALAMAVGMVATLPIPGNIAAIIAVAEGIRKISGMWSKAYEWGEVPEMQCKSMRKGQLYGTNDGEMSATFVLSTQTKDRDGETVNPDGGDLEEYAKNPVVAFNHNTDDFPIGTSADKDGNVKIWTDDVEIDGEKRRALLGKVYFSKANPKGRLAYEMVKEGTLRGCSISFLPQGETKKNENGGNHYEKWKLLEWSICPVGSNPDAVRLAKRLKTVGAKSMSLCVRKIWVKDKSAWLKAEDGEADAATMEALEEQGIDEVRIEDGEPEERGWEEDEAPTEKGAPNFSTEIAREGVYVTLSGQRVAGPFTDESQLRQAADEARRGKSKGVNKGWINWNRLLEIGAHIGTGVGLGAAGYSMARDNIEASTAVAFAAFLTGSSLVNTVRRWIDSVNKPGDGSKSKSAPNFGTEIAREGVYVTLSGQRVAGPFTDVSQLRQAADEAQRGKSFDKSPQPPLRPDYAFGKNRPLLQSDFVIYPTENSVFPYGLRLPDGSKLASFESRSEAQRYIDTLISGSKYSFSQRKSKGWVDWAKLAASVGGAAALTSFGGITGGALATYLLGSQILRIVEMFEQRIGEKKTMSTRKMWRKGGTAWLKAEDGEADAATMEALEEQGIDEVRIEDGEPAERGWEEDEAPTEKGDLRLGTDYGRGRPLLESDFVIYQTGRSFPFGVRTPIGDTLEIFRTRQEAEQFVRGAAIGSSHVGVRQRSKSSPNDDDDEDKSATTKSKRYTKSEQQEQIELAAFLDDAANAPDTPKRLASGMKFHAGQLKSKIASCEEKTDEITEEDEVVIEQAVKSLHASETRLSDTLFRFTGVKLN
jgi:HK97 family phage prohead protease